MPSPGGLAQLTGRVKEELSATDRIYVVIHFTYRHPSSFQGSHAPGWAPRPGSTTIYEQTFLIRVGGDPSLVLADQAELPGARRRSNTNLRVRRTGHDFLDGTLRAPASGPPPGTYPPRRTVLIILLATGATQAYRRRHPGAPGLHAWASRIDSTIGQPCRFNGSPPPGIPPPRPGGLRNFDPRRRDAFAATSGKTINAIGGRASATDAPIRSTPAQEQALFDTRRGRRAGTTVETGQKL